MQITFRFTTTRSRLLTVKEMCSLPSFTSNSCLPTRSGSGQLLSSSLRGAENRAIRVHTCKQNHRCPLLKHFSSKLLHNASLVQSPAEGLGERGYFVCAQTKFDPSRHRKIINAKRRSARGPDSCSKDAMRQTSMRNPYWCAIDRPHRHSRFSRVSA